MLWHGLGRQRMNGGSFEINHLSYFVDDTALVADSEEKLCRLASELGRVCGRGKFRVNLARVRF